MKQLHELVQQMAANNVQMLMVWVLNQCEDAFCELFTSQLSVPIEGGITITAIRAPG